MRQVRFGKVAAVAVGFATVLWFGARAPVEAQSREIDMDRKQSERMTLEIRRGGMPCPLAKKAFVTRVDQVATEVRVHCGPFTGPGLTNSQVYRVTFLTNGSSFIKPWTASSWPPKPVGQ